MTWLNVLVSVGCRVLQNCMNRRWKRRVVNAHHSILPPSGRHPRIVNVAFRFFGEAPKFKPGKEIISQLTPFKLLVKCMVLFHP
jgi:hypothetical protein